MPDRTPFRPWRARLDLIGGRAGVARLGTDSGMLSVSVLCDRLARPATDLPTGTFLELSSIRYPTLHRRSRSDFLWTGNRLRSVTDERGETLHWQYEAFEVIPALPFRLSRVAVGHSNGKEELVEIRLGSRRTEGGRTYHADVDVVAIPGGTRRHRLSQMGGELVVDSVCDGAGPDAIEWSCTGTTWMRVQGEARPRSSTSWVVDGAGRHDLPDPDHDVDLCRGGPRPGDGDVEAPVRGQARRGVPGRTDVRRRSSSWAHRRSTIPTPAGGGARQRQASTREIPSLDFRYVTRSDSDHVWRVAGRDELTLYAIDDDCENSVVHVDQPGHGRTTYHYDSMPGTLSAVDYSDGVHASVTRDPWTDQVETIAVESASGGADGRIATTTDA